MKKLMASVFVLGVMAMPVLAQVTWDGGGDGTSWDDPENWSEDALPTSSDDVIVNAPGTTIVGYEMNVSDLFDTLDWQAGTYSGDLYYGYDTTTELTVSGGYFSPGHLQVGRNHDATMTQTGGEVVAGGALNLGEVDFPGYGTYNMNGGYLEIPGIAVHYGEFNYTGGTVRIDGDYTGIAEEAYFNGSPSVSYDGEYTVLTPEPGTMALLGLGGLLLRRRRQVKA